MVYESKIIKLNYSFKEALEDWYSDCDNDSLY